MPLGGSEEVRLLLVRQDIKEDIAERAELEHARFR